MRKILPLVVVLAACSSKTPNPPATPVVNADAGPVGDGGLEAGTNEAGVAQDMDGGAGDAGGLVMPSVPAEALDVAIDTAVGAQASKLAPKMAMEGQPLRATLKEGERANLLVTMAPGKCYTFVAFSPPGQVAQVDLKLMAPPFYNVEAAKSGAADKNPAVIGKGSAPQCPVSPIAVPYRIDAVAAKGAGRVGVYVYSRSK